MCRSRIAGLESRSVIFCNAAARPGLHIQNSLANQQLKDGGRYLYPCIDHNNHSAGLLIGTVFFFRRGHRSKADLFLFVPVIKQELEMTDRISVIDYRIVLDN